MSSRARWIILSLALVGLGFATSSAWVHYKLLTDPAYISPCDISARFNCSEVYRSQWGSVAGVPVALGGVFWFGLVALVAWSSGAGADAAAAKRPGGAYLFAIATVGLAVILYLGYTSWFVLKTACVLCLGTYACVVGIFITSGVSSSMSVSQLPGRFVKDLGHALRQPLVVALTVLLVGATAFAAANFPREGAALAQQTQGAELSSDAVANFTQAWNAQPRADLGIPLEGAKVLIVKFNDYQCPGCGATHQWYKPVLEKFEQTNPGAIKYVLKDWPWNSRCNFTLPPGGGPNHLGACEGAAAVRMARDRGKALEAQMQDWLYSNQTTMTPQTVQAAAERILGVTDFASEYARKLPDIRKDVSDGVALRIQTTPTLFINGVRIEQIMPAQFFELAIQLELKKTAGK